MQWRTVRFELAPTGEFPKGSVARCYFVRLPMDDSGKLVPGELKAHPKRATARRYWSSEADQWGHALLEDGRILLKLNGKLRELRFDKDIALGELARIDEEGEPLAFLIAGINPGA